MIKLFRGTHEEVEKQANEWLREHDEKIRVIDVSHKTIGKYSDWVSVMIHYYEFHS